nr:hypothetical protein CKG001_13930 [Bdellovibrio sp. CKG001]
MNFQYWVKIARSIRGLSLGVLIIFVLGACSPDNLVWSSKITKISGRLLASPSSASNKQLAKIGDVSVACVGAKAKLYKIDSNGDVVQSALGETDVAADGTYEFKTKNLGVEFRNGQPSIPLVVNIEACGEVLSRPVTAAQNQDVSKGATLLSYVLNTGEKKKLVENLYSSRDKIEALIKFLHESSTVSEAYQSLSGNSQMNDIFVGVLGVSPAVLTDAAPQILSLEIPNEGLELQPISMAVSAGHWSPDYQAVYVWKVDSQQISSNTSFIYTPSANAQGSHTVSLYVGKDNGVGGLDLNKPYKILTKAILVQNNVPAVAPALSLLTSSPTSTQSVEVSFNTGGGLANCATFSKLALTVDEPTAPVDLSRYDITCSQAGTQTQALTLPNGDGNKVIRLWALDASNNVSASASSVSIILEQNPPVVTLQNLASLIRGGSNQNVLFTAQDLGVGVAQIVLEYAQDGVGFVELTSIEDPVQTSFTYHWSVPEHNTATAKLRLRAQDRAGNWSVVTTSSFEIDSLAPVLTLSSLNSGSYLGGSTQNISWSASDLHLASSPIKLEYSTDNGAAWNTIVSSMNNTGSYSWQLPVIDSALVRVRVSATDLVGNVTQASSSASLTIDSTAPNLPAVNLASASYSNSSTVNLSLSTCADIAKILINESLVPPAAGSPSWQNCGLSPSYVVSGEGLHTLQVWVQDAVGNVNSSSLSRSMTLDTSSPLVALTSLNSGSFRGGSAQTISWSASDINFSATPIKLEYSSDNGGTWAEIVSNLANSGVYTWTLPAITSSQVKVRVTADDLAGNSSAAMSSGSLTIDSTAPAALGLVRTSGSPSNLPEVTMSVSGCSGDATHMLFSEGSSAPTADTGSWETCAASKSFTVSTGDGSKTVYAWSKDAVGNISPVSSGSMVLDQTAPVVTLTSFNSADFYVGGSTKDITWTASDAHLAATPVKIEYSTDSGATWVTYRSATENDGTEAWSLPLVDSSQVRLRLTVADSVGNPATVVFGAADFTIESTLPAVSAFSITQGAATSLQNIQINLAATSQVTKISHFCIKMNSPSVPTLSDACWRAVDAAPPGLTPAKNLSLNNYYVQLGFTSGSYTFYGFVKNQAGLISNLSDSGSGSAGIDSATTNYVAPLPPTVLNVIAANTDMPQLPSVDSEYLVSAGGNVFVKWKAEGASPLGSHPVSLYYTTNDSDYTLIASGLLNGANGACTPDHAGTTIDNGNTGCYLWSGGAPAGYFRVKVVATNEGSLSTSGVSSILNSGSVRILAGNTEPGIGASAKSAVLRIRKGTSRLANQQFVVMPNGTIIVIDTGKGLMKIDPADGNYNVLIPRTGTVGNEGDGGPIEAAKVADPIKITMDFQSNLYVWDRVRIRKINTQSTPWTIDTIIGGGSSSSDGINAKSLQLDIPSNDSSPNVLFQVRPNGQIYFVARGFSSPMTASVPPYIWIYNPIDNLVHRHLRGGIGHSADANADTAPLGAVYLGVSYNPVDSSTNSILGLVGLGGGSTARTRYNPTTYQTMTPFHTNDTGQTMNMVAGMDGKLYGIANGTPIRVFNESTSAFVNVLGASGVGYCEDGTLASACRMLIYDAFIDANSKIYWNDWGVIRTLDQDGKVITIAGQHLFFGDGITANSARMDSIAKIALKSTGEVVMLDPATYRIRQVNNDGTMSLLAGNGGNGIPNTTSLANQQGIAVDFWVNTYSLAVSTSDEVHYNRGLRISKISNSTGKWEDVAGNGATSYKTGDGGTVAFDSAYYPKIMGFMGNSIAAVTASWCSTYCHSLMKSYDTSGIQSQIAGIVGNSSSGWPADGSNVGTSAIPHAANIGQMAYDSSLNRWYLGGSATARYFEPNGAIGTLFTDPAGEGVGGITATRASGSLVVYYCAAGKIKKWSQATGQFTTLPWPTTSMSCTDAMAIRNSDGSLVFGFRQNGMSGIAQYSNPP